MSLVNRNGFYIAGRHLTCVEEFEEACFDEPELEELFNEMYYLNNLKSDIDTYYAFAEMEYGDGNIEMPMDIWCDDEDYTPMF